ncbi:MAG: hypothetical protein A2Y78_11245 [Acidobacteria bacterium RBG_13_68_16]|nr:MAG: hypothetical protein A2Y78_11245 [Acidobacteria bacterium RBG_13_68_16]
MVVGPAMQTSMVRWTPQQRQSLDLSFARGLQPRAAATSEAVAPHPQILELWKVGRPAHQDANPTSSAEMFRRRSLAHVCISQFSSSIAEAPLFAERYGVRLSPKDDLLAELAEKLNNELTPYQYTQRLAADAKIHDEAFIFKARSQVGIVRELWPLRVDQVNPIPGRGGAIHHYEIKGWPDIPARNIAHLKGYDPLNDYRGLSPLQVLKLEGLLDSDALLYLGEFFRNGGLPSVVLTSPATLTAEQRQISRDEYRETTGRRTGLPGDTGWHEPFVMSNGATITELGGDLSKLDLSSIFDLSESRTCAVMGVPAIIAGVRIGLLQAQAYGTAREARRDWWGKDLGPFLTSLGQWHTLMIASEFGPGYKLRFDLRKVAALKEARSVQLRDASLMFSQGVFSRDQALEWVGEDPVDGRPVYAAEAKQAPQPTGAAA